MFLEYADWPDDLRKIALNRPFAQIKLDYDRCGDRLEIFPPNLDALNLPDLVFAKLGPKSWRDRQGATCAGAVAQLLSRLARPTPQQLCLIEAISNAGAPIWLTLSRARDFSRITEYRLHITARGTSLRSFCARGDNVDLSRLEEFGATIVSILKHSVIADIAILPGGKLVLIDVNPLPGNPPAESRTIHYCLVGNAHV